MKSIISKNLSKSWLKKRKNNLDKLRRYWSTIYPDYYVKEWTKAEVTNALTKLASSAKDVIFTGTVLQTSDGFVYVDVPNSIFNGFIPLLDDAEKPPRNEKHYDDIGAHITLIKSKEIKNNNINFTDAGKVVNYVITGVQEVNDPDGWEEMEKVWFLKVQSEELENLRLKYNLPKRIKDHDFHITIGVKRRHFGE